MANNPKLLPALVSELLGTALLVGAQIGTGYQISKLTEDAGLTLFGIMIASALALAIGITIGGPISGGHFNPAVTIGLTITGDSPTSKLLPYIGAQLLGAAVAAITANYLWGGNLIATTSGELPGATMLVSELLATLVLVGIVITMVRRNGGQGLNWLVPAWVGVAIILTPTGCMANPAVTFGHALTDSATSSGLAGVGPFIGIQVLAAVLIATFVTFFATKNTKKTAKK
jgi:glycerol uptake facilitator-like aquaporin